MTSAEVIHQTPGHALHEILLRLRQSTAGTVRDGWIDVLDMEAGSVGWARRHAEIVSLFGDMMEQVLSLPPEEPARSRALRYSATWYRAIVWQGHWQNPGEPARSLIDDMTLDQLEATADFLAYRLPSQAPKSDPASLAHLQGQVEAWLTLLDETPELPEELRIQIARQMQHILWLLKNVDVFGVAPVIRETQVAVGKVTQAMFSLRSNAGWKRRWIMRCGELVVALGLVTQGIEATNNVLEAARETVATVGEIVQSAETLFHGPQALTTGETPPTEPSTGEVD
ncbi:hypothetical protein [Modestobacter sp. VKM Ac-2984]|uniref:hypothetical protein n=1 Tax=Modestobacter sp. VKM Ac-2984 TaxID=3004138 RepID=UPI0022AABD02|nr:hypothetical protein [Modestobacter sp. VKM Ac-2984]MCZ2815227.1 hypothetical protein [Modestobacter sp. VKM Ac-2984]